MDVFSLRDAVVGDEYRTFATSFTTIHAEDIRQQVGAIYTEGRFWPEPLIQINPSYKRGANLAGLIASGALDRAAARSPTSQLCIACFDAPSSSARRSRTSCSTPSRHIPPAFRRPPK